MKVLRFPSWYEREKRIKELWGKALKLTDRMQALDEPFSATVANRGFLILFGAAALAAALAVGLGAREIVTRYLDDRFGKNR